MSITNGTVEFTRRITTGDYQHKDAKVSLTFVVSDQEDALTMLEYVGNRAVERALAMVGEKVPVSNLETAVDAEGKPYHGMAPQTEGWTGPKAGKPARNLADIMGEVAPNPTATAASPVTATAEPEAPAPVVISDKRLTDEVSSHNARLITAAGSDDTQRQLATQRVLKLVDEYTQLPPGPGRLSKVPQDKRAAFLEALGELA